MNKNGAAEVATDGLIWLAGRPEDISRFLAATGAEPADLRRRAGEPEFLGFVLDFLLGDEALAREFAGAAGLGPEDTLRARMLLPGGALPNWT
jgi:hypothetical protein